MEFGLKLRKLMSLRRVSQAELGQAVDVSQGQVSKWTRGVNVPDIRQGLAIARFLGTALDYLADDDQDDAPASEVTDEERIALRVIRATGLGADDVIRAVNAYARNGAATVTAVTDVRRYDRPPPPAKGVG